MLQARQTLKKTKKGIFSRDTPKKVFVCLFFGKECMLVCVFVGMQCSYTSLFSSSQRKEFLPECLKYYFPVFYSFPGRQHNKWTLYVEILETFWFLIFWCVDLYLLNKEKQILQILKSKQSVCAVHVYALPNTELRFLFFMIDDQFVLRLYLC